MFHPLNGINHTKQYISNPTYRTQYKQYTESIIKAMTNQLAQPGTYKLTNNSNTFYIVSPSNYEPGSIQLTTFINNEPYSHSTYSNIIKLINENKILFTIQQYSITESIKEEIA